ncbi:MAG: ATP-grasp domain-containing protein [Candidatus Helarchaeota archaeon]
MKKIIIVGDERAEGNLWREAFRNRDEQYQVYFVEVSKLCDIGVRRRKEGEDGLYISTKTEGFWSPDGLIWRWGAVKPNWIHEPFLELLKSFPNFPMVSCAEAHYICANRLRMLSALSSDNKIPIVPHVAFVTGRFLIESKFKPSFPCVVKVGSFHQGLFKMKVLNEDMWQDLQSFIFPIEMPVVIEDFIKFKRDLRLIFIGEKTWALIREFEGWKANRLKKLYIEEPTKEMLEITNSARKVIGNPEYGALDLVETENGFIVFEINDTPDLDPDTIQVPDAYRMVVDILIEKMK